MHVPFASAFILAACVVSLSPNAQQTSRPTVQRDPQALAIALRSISAMGGPQALVAYKDSVTTGALTVFGTELTNSRIVIKSRGTRQVRVELQKPGGTNTRILNQGRAVLSQAGSEQLRHLNPKNTFAERVHHLPLFSLLAEYDQPGVIVRYLGTEQIGSQAAFVLSLAIALPATFGGLEEQDTAEIRIYVDQVSALVLKIQYPHYSEAIPSDQETMETYFSDYRTVSGIAVPFRQITYMQGKPESELVLSSVTFNVGLPDTEFVLAQ